MKVKSVGHTIIGLLGSAGLTALIDHLTGGFGDVVAVALVGGLHTVYTAVNAFLASKGIDVPVLATAEASIDSFVRKLSVPLTELVDSILSKLGHSGATPNS